MRMVIILLIIILVVEVLSGQTGVTYVGKEKKDTIYIHYSGKWHFCRNPKCLYQGEAIFNSFYNPESNNGAFEKYTWDRIHFYHPEYSFEKLDSVYQKEIKSFSFAKG